MRRLPLIRAGSCSLCGDCCVGDPFAGTRGAPEIAGMCPALRQQPDGTRTCSLHGSDDAYWTNACRLWPSKPEHVHQPHIRACGFAFVRVGDGG